MIENGGSIKDMAACVATPCEVDECKEREFFERRVYAMTDENKAGELIARIRRKRKAK
jgi:hypothetical protein